MEVSEHCKEYRQTRGKEIGGVGCRKGADLRNQRKWRRGARGYQGKAGGMVS